MVFLNQNETRLENFGNQSPSPPSTVCTAYLVGEVCSTEVKPDIQLENGWGWGVRKEMNHQP